jgi:hypothetical protein
VSPVDGVGNTVAVNVTELPNVDGLAEEESVVVVLAWSTTCVNGVDVLDASFVSPEYAAVMVCAPTGNEDVTTVAVLAGVTEYR